jgi:hypothetical protein
MNFFVSNNILGKLYLPLAAHFSASGDDSEFVPPAATRIPTDRLWPPGDRTGARLFQKVFHTDRVLNAVH